MSLFNRINTNIMRNNNNNNNNNNNTMDLIPFNLTTFTISNLKPIVYKYSYFCDTTNANLIEP